MSHCLAGVAHRRKMLGISATTLADRIGVAANSFGRLERGQRRCYLDKAHALADMLGCTIEALAHEPTLDEKIANLKADERRRALLTAGSGDEKVAAVAKGWGDDPLPGDAPDQTIGSVVSGAPEQEDEARVTYDFGDEGDGA